MGEGRNGNQGPVRSRKKIALTAFGIVCLAIVASGAFYWRYRGTHISTDDAFVEGRIHLVSSRVAGTVVRILADDNQRVRKGQPLLSIDPEPYAVRTRAAESALSAAGSDVSAAQADLNAARQDLAAASARLAQARVAVRAAQAKVALAEADFAQAVRDAERSQALFERHSISRERNEKAQTARDVAKARADAAREEQRLAEAAIPTLTALISQRRAVLAQREARIGQQSAVKRQREASLAEAKLLQGYTEVVAPADGYITRKTVEAGQVVGAGQPLLAVASLGDVWIVANYKETEVGRIRPGQEVRIVADTYPDKTFRGKVDSIMAGTGSAFSLFPPENATGNYVKVVQRVPVKIVLETAEDPNHLLRIGMSVVPTVLARRSP
ncbi:MAG: HlyD family secretion protein [Deltaproteobacteria bacterium]|nr:HlyD family secretion protein [Deltaproteobacteria bacterium]